MTPRNGVLPPDGFIEARGYRLEFKYQRGGSLPSTVLVFLHEGLGCVDLWRDFPAQLATATGMSWFAYSRAGYGRSDPVALPRPVRFMENEAEFVLPRVLDYCGFDEVIYVGHSDGASIALLNAALAPSASLVGLILMAPHVFVEEVSLEGIRVAARSYRETNLRERLRRFHGERVDGAFWGWNQVWQDPAFRDWDITAAIEGVTHPLMLLQGHDDAYGTMAQLDAIEAAVAGPVTRVELEACGHTPFRDQGPATLRACREFVQTLVRRD
ncbi:MAG: alpha/beta hydrolase [Pseudomonadota bacterium]